MSVALVSCGCALGPSAPAESIQPAPPAVQQGAACPSPGVVYSSPFGSGAPVVPIANPLPVPVVDLDFAWEQIVAVIEENFKIQHEERVRMAGDVLTEGRIDTMPLAASTLLESWRTDSVGFHDRLLSTLQSRRRRCYVRVIPVQGAFLVDLQVMNELEDLPKPTTAVNGLAVFDQIQGVDRTSDPLPSLASPPGVPPRPAPPVPGWIPEGRDVPLEQVMLAKIQSRLAPFAAPAFVAPGGTFGIPPAKQ
ncbi:MAG TPA: hypothetical protein VHX65_06430 [Pirellulales bacterium]|nr:hypothetical protein [Pirellulales bacterium]